MMHNENDMSVRIIVYVDIFCKIRDLVKFTRKDNNQNSIYNNLKRNNLLITQVIEKVTVVSDYEF